MSWCVWCVFEGVRCYGTYVFEGVWLYQCFIKPPSPRCTVAYGTVIVWKEGMVQDVFQLGWVGCVSVSQWCGGEGVAIPKGRGEIHMYVKGWDVVCCQYVTGVDVKAINLLRWDPAYGRVLIAEKFVIMFCLVLLHFLVFTVGGCSFSITGNWECWDYWECWDVVSTRERNLWHDS